MKETMKGSVEIKDNKGSEWRSHRERCLSLFIPKTHFTRGLWRTHTHTPHPPSQLLRCGGGQICATTPLPALGPVLEELDCFHAFLHHRVLSAGLLVSSTRSRTHTSAREAILLLLAQTVNKDLREHMVRRVHAGIPHHTLLLKTGSFVLQIAGIHGQRLKYSICICIC